MENVGFERLIETVLRGLGAVDTKIVPKKKDKGIDIYATFLVAGAFRQFVGIQAKFFQPKPPVGADVVSQLTHGIEEGPEKVTLGMVITSGNFSPEAEAEAKRYEEDKGIPIELVAGEKSTHPVTHTSKYAWAAPGGPYCVPAFPHGFRPRLKLYGNLELMTPSRPTEARWLPGQDARRRGIRHARRLKNGLY